MQLHFHARITINVPCSCRNYFFFSLPVIRAELNTSKVNKYFILFYTRTLSKIYDKILDDLRSDILGVVKFLDDIHSGRCCHWFPMCIQYLLVVTWVPCVYMELTSPQNVQSSNCKLMCHKESASIPGKFGTFLFSVLWVENLLFQSFVWLHIYPMKQWNESHSRN